MSSNYFRVKITLKHQGKEYSFESDTHINDNDNGACYWWEEGNGACDCNRSLYIHRHADGSFPEMECGDTIELVKIEPLFEYTKEPVFLNGKWTEAIK